MEKTRRQKLARYWDNKINPVTGFKQNRGIDDRFIVDKKANDYNSCKDYLEQSKEDRLYAEKFKRKV
tara:strand:- start:2864 stop:3064 length:201 start_codon:yes stop_codon:yes gene_type:complete